MGTDVSRLNGAAMIALMGGHRHPTPFRPDDPQNAAWAGQVGHVKAFFGALEYWKLEPHDELARCKAPRGQDRKGRADAGGRGAATLRVAGTTYWCLAEPGRTYVVYVRGTTEPVTLALPDGGPWQVRQFDPRSGKSGTVRAPAGPAGVGLTAPDSQDWVFVVESRR